jgi:hypothetical protein
MPCGKADARASLELRMSNKSYQSQMPEYVIVSTVVMSSFTEEDVAEEKNS